MNVNEVAEESYNFWITKTKNTNAIFAILGNEEGETGYKLGAIGDKGTAYGPFQHHQLRIDAIKKGCSIDIKTASHKDQLSGAYWEMTEGSYKKVWPKLEKSASIREAVQILVHDYEQSARQDSDIIKRTAYAEKWQIYFTAKNITDELKPLDTSKLTLRISPVAYTKDEFSNFIHNLDLKNLKWKPQFITLHNTASPTLKQWSNYGPALQKRWPQNLNNYYSNLGWHSSVHLVMTPDYIWNLCNLLEDGVSVSCWNKITIGIEMVGDYESEQFDSGLGLDVQNNAVHSVAVLCTKFGWNPSDYKIGVKGLHFHKECIKDHHPCPGKNVDKKDFIEKVIAKMLELKK